MENGGKKNQKLVEGKWKADKNPPQTNKRTFSISYGSVSQPQGRGPVPGPGINYTGPREVLLEVVILVFSAFFINKYFIVEIF